MDERPKKRPGPLTLLMTRARWRWLAVVMLFLVLYALSSGPAQTFSFRLRMARTASGTPIQVFDAGWWPQIYRPIWWAMQQPWGQPVKAYLGLFPYVKRGPPVQTPLPPGHDAKNPKPALADSSTATS